MALTVERLTEDRLADAASLFHAYRQYFAPQAATDAQASRRFLEARLKADECVTFIAVDGDDAVGFIQLYPLWSSWYCGRIWFLSDLYVEERARSMGAASALVERVKAYARETGAVSVMVELPKHEAHLYDFYDKRGFKRDAVFDLARYELPH